MYKCKIIYNSHYHDPLIIILEIFIIPANIPLPAPLAFTPQTPRTRTLAPSNANDTFPPKALGHLARVRHARPSPAAIALGYSACHTGLIIIIITLYLAITISNLL